MASLLEVALGVELAEQMTETTSQGTRWGRVGRTGSEVHGNGRRLREKGERFFLMIQKGERWRYTFLKEVRKVGERRKK